MYGCTDGSNEDTVASLRDGSGVCFRRDAEVQDSAGERSANFECGDDGASQLGDGVVLWT